MFAELRELLRSGAIRRHQLGLKYLLPPMIHGLLRISCSRNPKTPQIRSGSAKRKNQNRNGMTEVALFL